MGKITKIWAGIVVLVFMLSGCSTMPKRPESVARGDYGYTKEYISWLIKKEMIKMMSPVSASPWWTING